MRNLIQFDFGVSVSVELTDNKPEQFALTRCTQCNNGQLVVITISKINKYDKRLIYCSVCERRYEVGCG